MANLKFLTIEDIVLVKNAEEKNLLISEPHECAKHIPVVEEEDS